MRTDSYMELALTVFAFDVSNKLSALLVGTGLIFIPVAWLFWKNWYEPARSQEAKAAAPVSLRRMEQDIGLAMLAMLLAFLPAINVSSSEITYSPPQTEVEVSANAVNTDTAQGPQSIRVPVLWWIVIRFSSGFTEIFKAAIHSFDSPENIRSLIMSLNYAKISDEGLRTELALFDNHCYNPALNAVVDRPAPERFWRGDDFWFAPQYYNNRLPRSPLIPNGWENQYSQPHNPGPTCAIWWSAAGKGLRDKLFDEMAEVVSNKQGPDDFMFASAAANPIPLDPSDEYKDNLIRSVLEQSPSATETAGGESTSPKGGIFSVIATLGAWMSYPVFRTIMAAMLIVLPIIQAIILACIYIALPLAVPFAVLRPGVLVFFIAAIFGTKFLTGIWALAQFIDERLISIMYGGHGVLAGASSALNIFLWIVSIVSYAGLPVIWFWLMSSFTSSAVTGVNSMFSSTATHLAMVGQAGAGAGQPLGGSVTKFLSGGDTKKTDESE